MNDLRNLEKRNLSGSPSTSEKTKLCPPRKLDVATLDRSWKQSSVKRNASIMGTANTNKTTTIQVSIETHEKLYSLKTQYEEIFKKPISFDQLIKALLLSKVDLLSEAYLL